MEPKRPMAWLRFFLLENKVGRADKSAYYDVFLKHLEPKLLFKRPTTRHRDYEIGAGECPTLEENYEETRLTYSLIVKFAYSFR